MRNVAGEIKGAEKAMSFALEQSAQVLHIYHDYTLICIIIEIFFCPVNPLFLTLFSPVDPPIRCICRRNGLLLCESKYSTPFALPPDKTADIVALIGLYGVDTRQLTRIIRECGVMNGAITTEDVYAKKEELLAQIQAYEIKDAVKTVTTKEIKRYTFSRR